MIKFFLFVLCRNVDTFHSCVDVLHSALSKDGTALKNVDVPPQVGRCLPLILAANCFASKLGKQEGGKDRLDVMS